MVGELNQRLKVDYRVGFLKKSWKEAVAVRFTCLCVARRQVVHYKVRGKEKTKRQSAKKDG